MTAVQTDLSVTTDPAEVGVDPARLRGSTGGWPGGWTTASSPGSWSPSPGTARWCTSAGTGHRDVEAGLPVTDDTRWRIFSMTKPITSVAAMMLCEEGAFELTDPISRWLPEFAEPRVYVEGLGRQAGARGRDRAHPRVAPADPHRRADLRLPPRPPRRRAVPRRRLRVVRPAGRSTPPGRAAWAEMPLLFQPGTEWNYSVSTDVLGRLIEVRRRPAAGRVPRGAHPRPAGHDARPGLRRRRPRPPGRLYLETRRAGGRSPDGGHGGLAPRAASRRCCPAAAGWCPRPGTTCGYVGAAAPRRSRTTACGCSAPAPSRTWSATTCPATSTWRRSAGRCSPRRRSRRRVRARLLGGASTRSATATLASPGDYSWGGAASTAFYVDPVEDLTVTFYTQLLPSSALPIRTYLRQLVNQALVD